MPETTSMTCVLLMALVCCDPFQSLLHRIGLKNACIEQGIWQLNA